MYKLTRKNGSFPVSLRGMFWSYDDARKALRPYLRKKLKEAGIRSKRSKHPSMWLAASLGYFISKV